MVHRKANIVTAFLFYVLWASPCLGFNREQFTTWADEPMEPVGLLAEAADGSLYGTSERGGSNGCGTVFKRAPNGVISTVISFNTNNGAVPEAGLILARDGKFYGTTRFGGAKNLGTLFKMTTKGELTTIISFDGSYSGAEPAAPLMQASNGYFYGTASTGGMNRGGTVFMLSPNGVLTTLFHFGEGNTGTNPHAGLVQAADGNLYGTTEEGGKYKCGTVYKISSQDRFSTFYHFYEFMGRKPKGELVAETNNLFGVTESGGDRQMGTAFRISTDGKSNRRLASFNGADGIQPSGLMRARDGGFYGTMRDGGNGHPFGIGSGTVFKMTPDGKLSVLVSFFDFNSVILDVIKNGKPTGDYTLDHGNGKSPQGFIQGRDGNFYGTTVLGGQWREGTLYRMTPEGELTTLTWFSSRNMTRGLRN